MIDHEATIKAIQAKLRKEEENGLFDRIVDQIAELEAKDAKTGDQDNRSDEADE